MVALKPSLKQKAMRQITARDYSGGLNLVDSDFNLSSKYAVDGYNMVPDDNGSLQVRWGTRSFNSPVIANDTSGYAVGMEYYYASLIVVTTKGTIFAVNAAGVETVIWDSTIAAALPGAPTGWGATLRVGFAQFLGSLIVTNGQDKPIIIDNTLTVRYLQDLGSGSNINTPVAKLVIAHSNYVVMAGDVNHPGRLYISNAGTSGTWPGDALPNDAITFDVNKYAPDAFGEITALASFRDRLVVFFSRYIVTLKLGQYSTATPPVHEPAIDDVIASYGAVSQRSVVNTGDQLIFLDFTGVAAVKQGTLTTTLTPERVSTLVDLRIQGDMSTLSRQALQDTAFAVYDRREGRIMFFIPIDPAPSSSADMAVYTLTMRKGKPSAWTQYKQWNFRAGAVSTEGRVFFVSGLNVYRHGSKYEPILTDYEGDRPFDGPTLEKNPIYVYGTLCQTTLLGQGIAFYHELPYNDLRDRTVWKSLHYLTMDTQGGSMFTLELYVDGLKNKQLLPGDPWSDGTVFDDGLGWGAGLSVPYASMTFVGGERSSFGITPALPATVRPTDDMRLYALYARFRFFKLALRGTSYSHLRVVAMSVYHTVGSIY